VNHWRQWATCAQVDPEVWYPDIGGYSVFSPAPKICRDCAVRIECLADCLVGGIAEGTWGGIASGPRRRIQRDFNRERPGDAETFAERAINEFDQLTRRPRRKICAA
jgi:WhiB family redox-sensing transcriptional regulator